MRKLLGLLCLALLVGCGDKGLVGKWHPSPVGPNAGIDGLTIEFRQDGTFLRAGGPLQHGFVSTSRGNREIDRTDSFYQDPGFMGHWRMAGKMLEIGEEASWQCMPFSWVDANHIDFMGMRYERIE